MANIKQTGRAKPKAVAKAKVNGVKKSPAATQTPVELTEHDREMVKKWLDNPATQFKVATAPASRKRKREGTLQPQTDIFEDRLSVQYEVKPRDKWECLRRYKKFTGE